jgi:cytochrome c556
VRATLIEKLKKEPSSPADWKRVRADAALIAETGALLQALAPPKGARSHWRDSAIAYLAAAEEIVAASDRRDYRRAGAGLKTLVACCMTCHDRHRR